LNVIRADDFWDFFANTVIPKLAAVSTDEPIRVWHAGCGLGQESCLLLFLLAEHLGREEALRRVTLYATDRDEAVLRQARRVTYSAQDAAVIPKPLRQQYLVPQAGGYVLPDAWRRRIVFGRHELQQDAPISYLDLLLCSHPLTALDNAVQDRILAGFHYALKDHGYLAVPRAHDPAVLSDLFRDVAPGRPVYEPQPRDKFDRLLLLAQAGALRSPEGKAITTLFRQARQIVAQESESRSQEQESEGRFASAESAQWVHLQAALKTLTDEVWICDAAGNLVMANEAAMRGIGVHNLAELAYAGPDWIKQLEIYTADGRYRTEDEAPLHLALQGQTVYKAEEIVRHLESGELLYRQVSAAPLQSDSGRITGALAVVRDITESKQLEMRLRQSQAGLEADLAAQKAHLLRAKENLRERNQELEALNQIGATVNSSLDPAELLPLLRQCLPELLPVSAGAIFLAGPPTGELRLRSSWGLPPILQREYMAPATVRRHIDEAVASQQPAIWPDWRQVDSFLTLGLDVARPHWGSYVCVPLQVDERVNGLLALFSQAPAQFNAEQQTFFAALGQQIGMALRNAHLHEEVVKKRWRLQALSEQVVSIQEEERRRLSHELHDEAGQVLVALNMQLKMVQHIVPPELAEVRDNIDEAGELARDLIDRMRRLARGLRPPGLDVLGIPELLEVLCRDFAGRSPLAIECRIGELPPLPDAVAVTVYRIVQEGLVNVVKHAAATRVEVVVVPGEKELRILVRDNGRGLPPDFDPPPGAAGNGIGLLTIHERVELLDGWMRIESLNGQGTQLEVAIPLAGVSESAAHQGRVSQSKAIPESA
jgi:PAS domain S-box-containing protein